MSEGKTKVLIAEDDFVVAKNLSITLEERGYEILGISESGEELLQSLSKQPTDIVIMEDIGNLWKIFEKFDDDQFAAIAPVETHYSNVDNFPYYGPVGKQ